MSVYGELATAHAYTRTYSVDDLNHTRSLHCTLPITRIHKHKHACAVHTYDQLKNSDRRLFDKLPPIASTALSVLHVLCELEVLLVHARVLGVDVMNAGHQS